MVRVTVIVMVVLVQALAPSEAWLKDFSIHAALER